MVLFIYFNSFYSVNYLTSKYSNPVNLKMYHYHHCVKSVPIRSCSGPYFPVFGLNLEICFVNLEIQSEYGKKQTTQIVNTDIFYAVHSSRSLLLLLQVFSTDNYEFWDGQLIKMNISSLCDGNLCLFIKFSGNITCKIILIYLLCLSRRGCALLCYVFIRCLLCFYFMKKILNMESTMFGTCH